MKMMTWVALGCAASALMGCSSGLESDIGEADEIGEVSQALAGPTVRLNKVDARVLTDVTVEIAYTLGSSRHVDYENLGTWNRNYSLELRRTTGYRDANGQYTGDFLHLTATGAACANNCTIEIANHEDRVVKDLVVSVWFVADGVPHNDYENVAFPSTVSAKELYVNGWGATLNSDWVYVGDILSSSPPPPPPLPPPARGHVGDLCLSGDRCYNGYGVVCQRQSDGVKRCQEDGGSVNTGGLNNACKSDGTCNGGLECKPSSIGESRCFSPSASCGNLYQACCQPPYTGGNPSCIVSAGAPTNHCVGSTCQN